MTTALVAVAVVMLVAGGIAGMRLAAERRTPDAAAPGPTPQPGGVVPLPGRPADQPVRSSGPSQPAASVSAATSPMAEGVSPSASAPATTRPVAPIGETPEDYGPFVCTEERWPIGHPVVGRVCQALGSTVRVKGLFSGVSGVRVNIEVSVENVDTGSRVAGPFRCSDRTFTDEVQQHTCGPQTVTLASGRYRVVGKWIYTEVNEIPGSVVGNPFTW